MENVEYAFEGCLKITTVPIIISPKGQQNDPTCFGSVLFVLVSFPLVLQWQLVYSAPFCKGVVGMPSSREKRGLGTESKFFLILRN